MKVLLVDDHPLILSALQTVIEGLGQDVTVVGVDSAARARAALVEHADLKLVLLDLSLGDADGFEVLADMRERFPALPVVVISATERHADVVRAVDMGAMGFIPKRSSNRELVEALALVMAGGVYIPQALLGLLSGRAEPSADGQASGAPMPSIADLARAEAHQSARGSLEAIGLTPRQRDVLALLLKGLPNKLIARELKLSVETVKDHVAAVLHALGVSSRTQAVLAVGQMSQGGAGFSTRKPG